jgi:hypothetical protein
VAFASPLIPRMFILASFNSLRPASIGPKFRPVSQF